MLKNVVLGLSLVGIVCLSGCSDTKESLEAEKNELLKECAPLMMGSTDKDLYEKCHEKEKDIKERMKILEASEK